MSKKVYYLDNAATTNMHADVFEAMLPYLNGGMYYNPSAIYGGGRTARVAVELARERVASLINAEPDEIVFTSGGTESNNFVMNFADSGNVRGKIITDAIEHASVLEAVRRSQCGCHIVGVDDIGLVDIEEIKNLLVDGASVVSVMTVNNEIGTMQFIKTIANIAHKNGAYMHTDAVQAIGHMKIDVKNTGVDFMSMSSHKIHGPKGVGALYIERTVPIEPMIDGGGQERGLRSGTENVAGIVGFGKACEIAEKNLDKTIQKVENITRKFEDLVMSTVKGAFVVGPSWVDRAPHITSIAFKGVEAESLVMLLDQDGIYCSTGSACSSHSLESSHVLKAIGVPDDVMYSVVRFSFGGYNSEKELRFVVDRISHYVDILRGV